MDSAHHFIDIFSVHLMEFRFFFNRCRVDLYTDFRDIDDEREAFLIRICWICPLFAAHTNRLTNN